MKMQPLAMEECLMEDGKANRSTTSFSKTSNSGDLMVEKPALEAVEQGEGAGDVSSSPSCRSKIGTFVNNESVQLFIVCLIMIDAIMSGIGTMDMVTKDPQLEPIFWMISAICLIIYTLEVLMQLIFHGCRFFLNGNLVFDFVVITLSWFLEGVTIFMTFRLFRTTPTNGGGLLSRVPLVKNLLLAVMGAMPSLCGVGVLLVVVVYVFGVMFTQLFKDLYENGLTSEDYFGRLDATFFTLFQIFTLDSWSQIAREVMAVYAWAWIPFVAYVSVTAFIIINLIIAVICNAMATVNKLGIARDSQGDTSNFNVWVCWKDPEEENDSSSSGAGKYHCDKVRGLSTAADISDLRAAFRDQHGVDHVKSPAHIRVFQNKNDCDNLELELKSSRQLKDLFVMNDGPGATEETALFLAVPSKKKDQ